MPSKMLTSVVEEVKKEFKTRFGSDPEVVVAAPGRVNLIGEHIDYNDGFVLPMAIDRYTAVAASATPGSDELATVYSIDMDDTVEIPLTNLVKGEQGHWSNYFSGVLAGMLEKTGSLPGFKAVSRSNVPIGGGLSSSASLEVAVATMIEAFQGEAIDPAAKGLVCQKAEHDFVGCPCGIMDQFASVLCQQDHVLLLDCRDESFEQIPFADDGVSVLIINSKVKHELSGGEYGQRRQRCDTAKEKLGLRSWRDISVEQLARREKELEPIEFQRARHVVTEIERTTSAAEAIRSGKFTTMGDLMYASHYSLRDDFEVSCKELDILVDLASKTDGVYGARMTGGGFGGCTVTLVDAAKADAASASICAAYREQTGVEPEAFITRPAQGAHVIG